jgi:hypothetical protein
MITPIDTEQNRSQCGNCKHWFPDEEMLVIDRNLKFCSQECNAIYFGASHGALVVLSEEMKWKI